MWCLDLLLTNYAQLVWYLVCEKLDFRSIENEKGIERKKENGISRHFAFPQGKQDK